MANTPKRLYFGRPSTTPQVVYTVPANTTTLVKSIVLHNPVTNSTKSTIWFLDSGESNSNSNMLINHTVKPDDTVVISDDGVFTVLGAGATIRASNSSSNGMMISISGVEVT